LPFKLKSDVGLENWRVYSEAEDARTELLGMGSTGVESIAAMIAAISSFVKTVRRIGCHSTQKSSSHSGFNL
jgi:hypothetical protein